MKVEALNIGNFRNIRNMEFVPHAGANIVFGDNAQGKTNLLEAIWLFTGAKSFRGARDSENVLFGEKGCSLELTFFAKERQQQGKILYYEEKKSVFLNEIKVESTTRLAGEFCAVVFSPDHLSLIKQGPDKRRRLIDTSLFQAFPKYSKVMEGYTRALRQRNTLLKDVGAHPSLWDTLEVWDERLLDYGAYVAAMRARYVKKLAELAKEVYFGISSGKEAFSAEYVCGFGGGDLKDVPREQAREMFKEALLKSRADDIRHGVTSVGPHRDDVEIMVDGISVRVFGSQGQQRSSILALKLAECGILEDRNQEPPVVLLDDVMSELDHGRRDFLLNQLEGKQVFITCCEAEAFSGLCDGKVFQIKNGAFVT